MANYQSVHSGQIIDAGITRAFEAILESTQDVSGVAWVDQNLLNLQSVVPSSAAVLNHLNNHFEPGLKNPQTSGEVLHSTVSGDRYWAPLGSSLTHNNLNGLDEKNAHPITAISTLEFELSERPTMLEHIVASLGAVD